MDGLNRIIRRISVHELNNVNDFYESLSGVNPAQVDPKYGNSVELARRLVADNCNIAMIYRRVRITAAEDDSVTLADGEQLVGAMTPLILRDASELYAFVIVLEGYSEIDFDSVDDIMVQYFADTWGSAFVECAQAGLAASIENELAAEGLIRTHLWSPGQHSFELRNQTAIFGLLHPEDIGCTLTKRLMMVPVKACSGIIGIISADTAASELPRPCDYCQFGSTCPTTRRKCAAL